MNRVGMKTFVCMFLILTILPQSTAITITKHTPQINQQEKNEISTYWFCYVNSSGIKSSYIRSFVIRHGYTGFTIALGLIPTYTTNAQTTINRNENGKEIMHYEGAHELQLIGFIGYSSAKENEDIWIKGRAVFVKIET